MKKLKQLAAFAAALQPNAEVELSAFTKPAGLGYNDWVKLCMDRRIRNNRKRKQRG